MTKYVNVKINKEKRQFNVYRFAVHNVISWRVLTYRVWCPVIACVFKRPPFNKVIFKENFFLAQFVTQLYKIIVK